MEYRKIVRAIASDKNKSLAEKIDLVKQNVPPGNFKDALKLNPLFNNFLSKSPFFKSIEDIYIKEPFRFSKNFKREFKWLTTNLEIHFEKINLFIEHKNNFENCLILDKYEKASEILKAVENNFGVSLWSIESHFIIEENLNGPEYNWNKLSSYLGQINDSIYEFNMNSSSKRIETKLSYESFLNQFQNDIDSINTISLLKDFFVFKNFNYPSYDYAHKNLESVIYVSNIFSIIDQYLILVDVMQYNISHSTENDNIFLQFLKKSKNFLHNDFRIINMYNILNDKGQLIENNTKNNILECLNQYYKGNFSRSFDLACNGLTNFPFEFEYYQVYCKSLINLNRPFVPKNLSAISDKVLENTFNLLSFIEDENMSYKTLLNVSLLFMNTNFGKQIFGLLSEIEDNDKKNYVIGILCSSFHSHKVLFIKNRKNKILKNFKNLLLNEHSFKVFGYKHSYDIDFDGIISNSNYQIIINEALKSFNNEDYIKTVEILLNNNTLNDIPYYYERKLSLLYKSYLKEDNLTQSLVLFGETFFLKDLSIKKINHKELFQKIRTLNDKEQAYKYIEYPILYSLNVKEYDLFEAYDDFMESKDLFNINEVNINQFIEDFSFDKTIYFLENVVTIDTLKYSSDYGAINDVEEERILILKKLIEFNKAKKLIYEKEINEIYRINSVRKVLKEVDQGRLFIDVNNLKDIQISKFKDDFIRFKEIQSSTAINKLIGFNPYNTKDWSSALNEKSESTESNNSADYLAFKNIYLESRENFLFSKEYGLDSSLSTRIRHGALRNHIRSVFEKLKLVTSKNNNEYRDNQKWKIQLVNNPELEIKVQQLLKGFSQEIDNYNKFILETLIQIQTEKSNYKQNSLFQYNSNDEILFSFYMEFKSRFDSVETTIDIILADLVNYTLIRVQNTIVDSFKNGISKRFQSIIDALINELRILKLPNECELIPSLMKSSTEIQNELEYISQWFNLNTTSSSSLLDIETILNASLDLTNRINPLFNLSPEIVKKIDLAGYSSLIFVFNIMFTNVIKHSKLETDKIKLKIELSLDKAEEYILVSFTNNLNPKEDYSENKNKLEKVKANWNNHENIERSNKEGDSGFVKIKRILIYEAMAKTDKFDYKITKSKISIIHYFPYQKPDSYE